MAYIWHPNPTWSNGTQRKLLANLILFMVYRPKAPLTSDKLYGGFWIFKPSRYGANTVKSTIKKLEKVKYKEINFKVD